MAVSYAATAIIYRGTFTEVYTEITMDSSYAASGETINASDVGLKEILGIWPASAKGYTVEAVKTNPASWLLKVYSFSATTNTVGAEIVTAKDLSALVMPCRILGR